MTLGLRFKKKKELVIFFFPSASALEALAVFLFSHGDEESVLKNFENQKTSG